MRKSTFGMGSVQRPGALKPHNSFTPNNNRRSAVQPGRKSHLPKPTGPDSAAKRGGQRKRSSVEGMTRLSLASTRMTPSRNTLAPPSFAPGSTSRPSMDSVRSSNGWNMRKETRPVFDSNFKSQCIDKILDFLLTEGYEQQVQRRTLLTPTTKDFVSIFNFIYRFLDSQYNLPNRFEEEIPRLLKNLKYPVQMSKSSFITVGSPHTWPSVLAMLAWLVDTVSIFTKIDDISMAFAPDFENDINIAKFRFETMKRLQGEEDPSEDEQVFEDYRHTLEQMYGVRPQDLIQMQEEETRLEDLASNLGNGPERLRCLKQQQEQLKDDVQKISSYLRDVQVVITEKEGELAQQEAVKAELKATVMQLKNEVASLETLKEQQGLSNEDLAKFKNHAKDVAALMSQLQEEGKDADKRIWSLEMELGKTLTSMNKEVNNYNSIVREIELPKEYEISAGGVVDNLHQMRAMTDELRTIKKDAKLSVYEMQTELMGKEEEMERIRENNQEKKNNLAKLESKLQRMEEDIAMTKNENEAEEQEMLKEDERLQHQISEARRVQKTGSLYQKQCEVETAQEKLDRMTEEMKERTRKGAQFLLKTHQTALEQLEWECCEATRFKITAENGHADLLKTISAAQKTRDTAHMKYLE